MTMTHMLPSPLEDRVVRRVCLCSHVGQKPILMASVSSLISVGRVYCVHHATSSCIILSLVDVAGSWLVMRRRVSMETHA